MHCVKVARVGGRFERELEVPASTGFEELLDRWSGRGLIASCSPTAHCGAYFMHGATRHKPGCEIAALIRAYFDPSVGPPPNRRRRSREAQNPD